MTDKLLEVDDLTVKYNVGGTDMTAVSNASFTIGKNEYKGLVGESGCGKSTIAKSIIGGLDKNGRITSGSVSYKGKEIQDMTERELNEEIRWKEISYIPQNSLESLNPLQRIKEQAYELAHVHTGMCKKESNDRLRELFEILGLQEDRISDYPYQFSGGMAQRAIIALSLLLDPELVIADEPTTALDVLVQDQILKHLELLKEDSSLSLLLITHDISTVFELCDNLVVMYAGQVAESGSIFDLYDMPRHPYTILLQESFPDYKNPDKQLEVIPGHPPRLTGEITQCSFADRCPWAELKCRETRPTFELVGDGSSQDHRAACLRREEMKGIYQERTDC